MKEKDKNQKKFEANEDCFAYRINGRGKGECDCLDDLYCVRQICKFYKSKEEYKKIKFESMNKMKGDFNIK